MVLALLTGPLCRAQLVIGLEGTVHAGAIGRVAPRMIVAFDEMAPIGAMEHGSVPVNVFLDRPVGESLMDLLDHSAAFDGPDRDVVLKVGRLRLLHLLTGLQLGMHMELLEQRSDGYHRLFEHGTSITTAGITKKEIGPMVVRAFQECLTAFAQGGPAPHNAPLDSAAVHAPMTIPMESMPIWAAGPATPGLYHTYADMRLDRRDTMHVAMRERLRSLSTDQLVKLVGMDKDITQQIWGFTQGGHIYKNLGKEFVRLERTPEGFSALWQAPMQTDPGSVAFGMFLGGIVGGVVAAGLSSEPGAVIRYALDPACGDLWPVKNAGDAPGSRSIHVFQYSGFAKPDVPVLVTGEEGKEAGLNKRNWTIVRPAPRLAHSFVTVRTASGDPVRVAVDTNADRTEVYLIDVKADGALTVKKLPAQMADKFIGDLKKEDLR